MWAPYPEADVAFCVCQFGSTLLDSVDLPRGKSTVTLSSIWPPNYPKKLAPGLFSLQNNLMFYMNIFKQAAENMGFAILGG